mmetsp:Transcript_8565/g.20813  ORF Transcript_8565/g.20813 Transcript_8565/m.20813 type:complete len:276 (-) Transcript_8565:1104-1931(-)
MPEKVTRTAFSVSHCRRHLSTTKTLCTARSHRAPHRTRQHSGGISFPPRVLLPPKQGLRPRVEPPGLAGLGQPPGESKSSRRFGEEAFRKAPARPGEPGERGENAGEHVDDGDPTNSLLAFENGDRKPSPASRSPPPWCFEGDTKFGRHDAAFVCVFDFEFVSPRLLPRVPPPRGPAPDAPGGPKVPHTEVWEKGLAQSKSDIGECAPISKWYAFSAFFSSCSSTNFFAFSSRSFFFSHFMAGVTTTSSCLLFIGVCSSFASKASGASFVSLSCG